MPRSESHVPLASRDLRGVQVERAGRLVEDPHARALVRVLFRIAQPRSAPRASRDSAGARSSRPPRSPSPACTALSISSVTLLNMPSAALAITMSTRGRFSWLARDHFDVDDLVALVPHGLRAEQPEDLRLEHAFVAHRLVAPDDERHLLGILAVLLRDAWRASDRRASRRAPTTRASAPCRDRCRRSSCRSGTSRDCGSARRRRPSARSRRRDRAAGCRARAGPTRRSARPYRPRAPSRRSAAGCDPTLDDRVDGASHAHPPRALGRTRAGRTECSASLSSIM